MKRIWILPLLILIECVVFWWVSPYFLDPQNLFDRSRHFVEIGIMAVAMTFVISNAGIDLSVGSIMGMVGVVTGFAWHFAGIPMPIACMLGLLSGLCAGLFNGYVITAFQIPPLLVTLAGLALYRGIAFGIAKDQNVSNFPEAYRWLGQGYWGIVPVQLIMMACVMAVGWWLFHKRILGRHTVLSGENVNAAYMAGIPVKRTQMMIYAMSGLCSAIAGIIFCARMNTAKPDFGAGYELDVITCVVLGGTKITGGCGSIMGTLFGLLLIGLLRYGLDLSGVPSVWVMFSLGLLLIVTAVINEKLAV